MHSNIGNKPAVSHDSACDTEHITMIKQPRKEQILTLSTVIAIDVTKSKPSNSFNTSV